MAMPAVSLLDSDILSKAWDIHYKATQNVPFTFVSLSRFIFLSPSPAIIGFLMSSGWLYSLDLEHWYTQLISHPLDTHFKTWDPLQQLYFPSQFLFSFAVFPWDRIWVGLPLILSYGTCSSALNEGVMRAERPRSLIHSWCLGIKYSRHRNLQHLFVGQ